MTWPNPAGDSRNGTFHDNELPPPFTTPEKCQETKWDERNPFNTEPHRCRLAKGHDGEHWCDHDNGTKDGCTFSWSAE